VGSRRPMGALESEVLVILWSSSAPQTPAEVLDKLESDLAYTTVMTVLARLWEKGLAERVKTGRAYSYSAKVSEADLAATRMRDQLARSSDRVATMSQFVSGLNKKEARQLRQILEERSG
jgi:predicted transcriptional regulator